ncbi:MAG: ABC transporter permease [Candidatus Thorarchaeota archaeon]
MKVNYTKPNSFFQQYKALAKKEIKIQLRYPIAFISQFIQIFLIILVFTFTAKVFINPESSTNSEHVLTASTLSTYMLFGLMAFLFFSDALYALGMSLRQEQTTGTLETIFLYPMNYLANLLAKITWSTFINIVLTFFGFITLNYLTGTVELAFPEFLYGLVIFIFYLLQVYGFSFFLAGLSLKLKESIEPIVNFSQFLFLILSAFFFPFSTLGPIVIISFFIPFSYAIDLMRTTVFGTNPELASILSKSIGYLNELIILEWLIVLFFMILLPILGYKYFKRTVDQGRFSGTLSDY